MMAVIKLSFMSKVYANVHQQRDRLIRQLGGPLICLKQNRSKANYVHVARHGSYMR